MGEIRIFHDTLGAYLEMRSKESLQATKNVCVPTQFVHVDIGRVNVHVICRQIVVKDDKTVFLGLGPRTCKMKFLMIPRPMIFRLVEHRFDESVDVRIILLLERRILCIFLRADFLKCGSMPHLVGGRMYARRFSKSGCM